MSDFQRSKKGWWLRFSLRSLVGFMIVAAIFLARQVSPVMSQMRNVATLEADGVSVTREMDPWGPRWLQSLLGIEFNSRVTGVTLREWHVDSRVFESLNGNFITNRHLEIVARLPDVHTVKIASDHIGDRGMRFLSTMPTITILEIEHHDDAPMAITDEGIAYLAKLPRLRRLVLTTSQASLESYAQLEHLIELETGVAQFSQAGMKALIDLPRIDTLDISCTSPGAPDWNPITQQVQRRLHRIRRIHVSGPRFKFDYPRSELSFN